MAATAYKMWSKEGIQESSTGKEIDVEGWHIVDAETKFEAQNAPELPRRNDARSPGSPYKVRDRNFTNYQGPTQWMAILSYAIPENGNFPSTPIDPLTLPFKWTSSPIMTSWVEDTDAYLKVRRNSAGDIFPPRQREIRRRLLTGRRYEPFWNLAKCKKYEDHTNSNPFSIGDTVVLPYECVCRSIEPVGEWEINADYLMMEYAFEVAVNERPTRDGNLPAVSGYPLEMHQLDIGDNGWGDLPGGGTFFGRFCRAKGTGSGAYVTGYATNVLLNGQGQPIDPDIKVCTRDELTIADPIPNPSTVQWLFGAPQGSGNVQSPFSTGAFPTWMYFNYQSVSFENIFTYAG